MLGTDEPEQIAAQLRELMTGGHYAEGDLLGTEAELMEKFDVSRPSLREALRILERRGLVSVIRGARGGVVVHEPDRQMATCTAALLLQSRNVALTDLFEASAILEPPAARMVAESGSNKRAAKELRELVVEQKQTISDPDRFTNAVQRFHEQIITLAGNQTLLMIKEMLHEVIARAVADVVERSRHDSLAERHRVIRSHELLVTLIEEGNGEVAQAHWNSHMGYARRQLLGTQATNVIRLSDHR
ncbi:FadR/GntR family transcriptional regulator [Mycobacterium celatum]|uniref:FadR/GntR family transcriptional regulator n=1 Tax=Mycobacterium celatum TaxID=28045 RepID=UPI001E483B96|nr:FCD domain-containing protein [Mycobacterium celatum]